MKHFGAVGQIVFQTGNSLMKAIEYIDEYKPDLVIKNEDHMDKTFKKNATSGFDLKLARYCPAPLLIMDSDLTEKSGQPLYSGEFQLVNSVN